MEKFNLKKLKKLRVDYDDLELSNESREDMLKGVLSPYHVGNFLFMFKTPHGFRREYDPPLAEKIDDVVGEMNFDLKPYADREYFSKHEAHEKAFPIYRRVHEKHGVDYKKLFYGKRNS